MWGDSIFIVACGLTVSACVGLLKSSSPEQLRIESEPPGAQASAGPQGPNCQTPCEFALPPNTEIPVSVALNGYQPVTVLVRPEGETLQPNPVHVDLQPVAPPAKPSPKKKPKQSATAQ
jgi:hypothetical protein